MEYDELSKALFKKMKVVQYESIPIVKDMECPSCHKSDVSGFLPCVSATPVGWCDTATGYMGVFECPKCFEKFRCHINTNGRYDEQKFFIDFSLICDVYNLKQFEI